MNAYSIKTVRYRETKNAELKNGIILDGGKGSLIDMKGKIVTECWDYIDGDIDVNAIIETNENQLIIKIQN